MSHSEFGTKSYWEERYAGQAKTNEEEESKGSEIYEWYNDYASLKPFLFRHLLTCIASPPTTTTTASTASTTTPTTTTTTTTTKRRKPRLLNVGCGNSSMSEEMFEDGFTSIVNVDFAPNVIDQMAERAKQKGILHPPQPQQTQQPQQPQQPQQGREEEKLFYYRTMDVTDMSTFQDDSFDGILDKGTVDSIMCALDGDQMVDRMYSEISRLLNKVNEFICCVN